MTLQTNIPFNGGSVLGYRIIERIGAGGYGEVWKAEAPGGLLKAVKILHGYHAEKKAQIELRALDKIKQLRHPFLLSLERIEVVQDHLVVITELADRSLADRYNEFAEQGHQGIPRDELITVLSQAAEALDFLAIEHRLQHLDVKPENILLVGRHAKLADFGLVKNLQDVTQSLMNGLTPAYASPELFDGRPSLSSDQYSLAMVYYEMLTGERCFDGKTAAQLAAQHMNAKPSLHKASKTDQMALQRALAKKPELRYRSCLEFIHDLNQQRVLQRERKRTFATAQPAPDGDTDSTAVKLADRPQTNDQTLSLSQSVIGNHRIKPRLVNAPDGQSPSSGLVPTLVVGVGKTGVRVCQRLKQKINDSLPSSDLPMIQLLAMDSDRSVISNVVGDGNHGTLSYSEGLAIPLRKPEEYRNRSRCHAGWLNRRWIYNVPKSLQTEGIRPLGRLALVDHFDAAWEQLENKIRKLATPDNLAHSMEVLGKDLQQGRVRVFLVSAISGGIGSGLTLDLAYTIKLILSDVGLPVEVVNGLLIHGTSSRECDPGISIANTLAFLAEMRHYTQHGYPGEACIGLPAIPDEFPIDAPYFLNFGENCAASDWDEKINSVADYLFVNTFSKAGEFFDTCRAIDQETDSFRLRSFGLANHGISLENSIALRQIVTKSVAQRWLGEKEVTGDEQFSLEAALERIPLELVRQQLSECLNTLVAESQVELRIQGLANVGTVNGNLVSAVIKDIRALFPMNSAEPAGTASVFINKSESIGNLLAANAQTTLQEIQRRILNEINLVFSGTRFSHRNYREAVKGFSDFLKALQDKLAADAVNHLTQADQLESGLQEALQAPRNKQVKNLEPVGRVREIAHHLRQAVLASAQSVSLRPILRAIQADAESVERARIQFANHCRNALVDTPVTVLQNRSVGLDRLILMQFLGQLERLVSATELRFFHQCVQPHGNYRDLLIQDNLNSIGLLEKLERFAQQEIVAFGKTCDLDRVLIEAASNDRGSISNEIEVLIENSKPLLDDCGGQSRLLVALPEFSPTVMVSDSISRSANVKVATEKVTHGNLLLIGETESVDLVHIIQRLREKRLDGLELARRLHTRNDVTWLELDNLL